MFLAIFIGYFLLLMALSYGIGRRQEDNGSWFLASRRSNWLLVAVGMVGSSISGVSFISVPGMVAAGGYNYMYMVVGFFFGYLIIARVLLPLYYSRGLTSIYGYLADRFGRRTHQTATWFFIISKLLASALSLYAVAMILQLLVFTPLGIPFWLTACVLVLMIWLYTFRSGVKTIIWTDMLQTVCMLLALVCMIVVVLSRLRSMQVQPQLLSFRVPQPWWRSVLGFLSGVFIPIVMTGLDQDKMQKNLTCRSLRESQKNMLTYGLAFVPVNLLFLLLGALMYRYVSAANLSAAVSTLMPDQLLPYLAANEWGGATAVFFALGLTAAAFSSADSALAALTTCYCVDLHADRSEDIRYRRWVHIVMCVLLAALLIAINSLNSRSLLDAVYTLVSYTYGPLLGLFIWGLYTKLPVRDRYVPLAMVIPPVLCYLLAQLTQTCLHYHFGYEILLLNAFLTLLGLLIFRRKA